jgi:hypothetical protein
MAAPAAVAKEKKTARPGVTIESPVQGAIVRPGSWVTIKVRPDAALKAQRVSLLVGAWDELWTVTDDQPPFELALPIDRTWSGPMRIVLSVLSKREKLVGSGELLINVLPPDAPVSIAVTDPVRMIAGGVSSDRQDHINVRGTYADGTVRDVARHDLGTTFHSSDPRVVAVDGEGFLTAGVPGQAVVIVKNGTLSEEVPIRVESTSAAR